MNVRPVEERDWEAIAWLASDEVQEGDHSSFGPAWVTRRREFDGEQAESVVDVDGDARAYCSLERASGVEGWRAFIVLDWSDSDVAIGEAAFAELERLVASRGGGRVWMRELEGDQTMLAFLARKGFVIEQRYEYEGLAMVNLAKTFGG